MTVHLHICTFSISEICRIFCILAVHFHTLICVICGNLFCIHLQISKSPNLQINMPSSQTNLAFLNDHLVPLDDPSLLSVNSDLVIYEVIRVMDGKCLFLEDHLNRLFNSAALAGRILNMSRSGLSLSLYKLLSANSLILGNIRLEIRFQKNEFQLIILIIPHHYPSTDDYKTGVKAISFKAERGNPNAKILNPGLRTRINELIREADAEEAVLVNSQGYVTEGSRSNLFFIKENTILTSPYDTVLVGITRDKVFDLCREMSFNIVERNINFSGINQFDSAFITGTSPRILPLNCIDNIPFETDNELMQKLMLAYNERIRQYLDKASA